MTHGCTVIHNKSIKIKAIARLLFIYPWLIYTLVFLFGRVPDFLLGEEVGGFGAGVRSLVAGTARLTRDIFFLGFFFLFSLYYLFSGEILSQFCNSRSKCSCSCCQFLRFFFLKTKSQTQTDNSISKYISQLALGFFLNLD